ncbi:MAG: hypothetical protein IJV27_09445 [Prevotella sp.]|nr:hypothetical protein [Prevotella sp.]
MQKIVIIALTALLALATPGSTWAWGGLRQTLAGAETEEPVQEHSPSVLIIICDQETGKGPLLEAIKAYGAEVVYDYSIIPGMAVRKPDGKTLEETMQHFKTVEGVVSVEYDHVYHLTDPVKPNQWNGESRPGSLENGRDSRASFACPLPSVTEEGKVELEFQVAKNYFYKQPAEGRNGQETLASLKITTEEEFSKHFGMATTMGEDGRPTEIDFTKQFVLAVVLPVIDMATEITPVKVEAKGDSLFYTYDVTVGEKQSYSTQPLSIIILDKKYENHEVILINE